MARRGRAVRTYDVDHPTTEYALDVIDGRTIKFQPGNLADDEDAVVSIADPPPGQATYIEYLPACQSRALPAGPSLNLQYCVFLK